MHLRFANALGLLTIFASANAVPIRRDDKANDNQFFQLHADCEGAAPGGTTIVDIGANSRPASDFPDLIPTLKWQYSGDTIPGTNPIRARLPEKRWTFVNGGVLHGTFVIEQYIAGDSDDDKGNCIHSAHLSCRYLPGEGDPAGLDFIQMVKSSRPHAGLPAGTLHIDPYPDTSADDSPFYFLPGQNRDKYRQAPHADGILFGDSPGASFPEATAHSITEDFWLVLSAPDPANSHNMKLYEGFQWGFTGGCNPVPEPGTCSLLAGLALYSTLRRRKHRCKP